MPNFNSGTTYKCPSCDNEITNVSYPEGFPEGTCEICGWSSENGTIEEEEK